MMDGGPARPSARSRIERGLTEQVQCLQLHAGRPGAGEGAASSGKIRVHSA